MGPGKDTHGTPIPEREGRGWATTRSTVRQTCTTKKTNTTVFDNVQMVQGVQEEAEEDRSSEDGRPERSAQHRRGKYHDHHCFQSSSIGHAQGHAPERAKKRRTREQVLPKGKKITFKAKNGSTLSMNFRLADVTKAMASVSEICHRRSRVVFDDEGRISWKS